MVETTKEIGEALRKRRESLDLTQEQAAERAGTLRPRVAELEAGVRDPRLSTVLNTARALGVEFMMVPRELVPAVEAMLRPAEQDDRPAFAPDETEEAEESANAPHP